MSGEGRRTGLVAGLLFAGAAALALVAGAGYLGRLAAVALGLAAALLAGPLVLRAYPFVRGEAAASQARRLLPPLLVAALAAALLAPLVLGQMPRSQDHTVHLARAWIFLHELVGQGRISGWSSYWFAGYPAGQLYPPGTDLWVSAFRLLHLGLPDWSFTYAQAFLAAMVLSGLAVYFLALRATGSRLAAALGGLAFLLDPGAYREGGWSFTVYWGVWSQVLGLAFAALALAALDRLFDRPSPRGLAALGLLVGASLLGHPMSLPTLAVFALLALACRAAYGPWPRGGLAVAAGGGLLGLGLAAFWLLPFMSRGEWTIKVPELWRPMDEAAGGVLSGAPFEDLWPFVGVLAVLGAVRAARERRPLLVALALGTAGLLFVSTSTAYEELRLEQVAASFARMIFQRLSIPAKLGLFVLAGFGASRLFAAARPAGEPPPLGRRAAVALLAGLLLSPLALHGAPLLGDRYLRGVGAVRTAAMEEDYPAYREFLDWSRERWDERDRFYRIAYVQPRNEHFMADAPAYNRTPAYKVGWTPATTFRHRPESDDPEVLRALSVRYVVARRPLAGSHLRLEESFGRLRVYRLEGERPERFHLEGPGRAEALDFEEELVRVRVTGASAATKLTLHVASYADWRASLDGEPLEVRTVPIYADRYPTFMQVDVPRDGVVEVRFVRPALRLACQLVSLLALAVVGLLLAAPGSPRLAALGRRLAPAGRLAVRWAPVAVALAAALVLAAGAVRWVRGADRGEPRLSWRFVEHLDEARAEVGRAGEGARPCARRGERLVCPGASFAWVGPETMTVGVRERRCIWAHPQSAGPLRLTFPAVPLGARLVGRHGLSDFAATQTPEGAPVRLEVSVEGGPRRAFVADNEVGFPAFSLETSALAGERRDVTLTVSSADELRRHYCFDGGVEAAPR